MKKMNVKKLAAAALLGIFAAGSGFTAWSAAPSFAAAGRYHGEWNCGGPRRGGCPYDGHCYDRQPGENCPGGPGWWGWLNGHWRGADFQRGGWVPDKKDYKVISEEMARDFGLDEKEILAACKDKRSLWDIMHAAAVAKASNQPFANVIRFKTAENSWGDVYAAMRVSPAMIRAAGADAMTNLMANYMADRLAMDKSQVKGLLEEGYRPRDIFCASVIAKLSDTGVKEILQEKKINKWWQDIAQAHNIDRETFWGEMEKMGGFGAGFHGRGHYGEGHRPMPLPLEAE